RHHRTRSDLRHLTLDPERGELLPQLLGGRGQAFSVDRPRRGGFARQDADGWQREALSPAVQGEPNGSALGILLLLFLARRRARRRLRLHDGRRDGERIGGWRRRVRRGRDLALPARVRRLRDRHARILGRLAIRSQAPRRTGTVARLERDANVRTGLERLVPLLVTPVA